MGVRASGAGAAGVQVMRGECVSSMGGGARRPRSRSEKVMKSVFTLQVWCRDLASMFLPLVRGTTGSSLASSRAGAVGEIFACGLPAIGRRA